MRLPLKISILLLAAPAFSQEAARRQARATRVEEAPVIDGLVEEEIWSRAEVITGFVQAEPHEGEPATENTEVRILYDDSTLYVGAICFDSDPSGIESDGQVSNEGEGGGQTSTRQRAQTSVGSGFNLNWDASFIVRTHRNEIGWMA